MKIKIDKEFSSWVRPLNSEEFSQLRSMVMSEGCRDPLVIWAEEGILIDGHNRYKICNDAGLPFSTHEISFADRDSVLEWIFNNSISRRNLQPIDKAQLVEKMKPIFKRLAKARQEASRTKPGEQVGQVVVNLPPPNAGKTRDQLGALVGVSGRTYDALAKVINHGDPEIINAVRDNIIGAQSASGILALPPEEQRNILDNKRIVKKPIPKKKSRKEIKEQREIDKNYSAESRQLFDLAIHQMKRIRDEDIYGIIVLKEMKKWCNEKIKIIKKENKK